MQVYRQQQKAGAALGAGKKRERKSSLTEYFNGTRQQQSDLKMTV